MLFQVFSSQLTDENHGLVLQVAINEFMAEQHALENFDIRSTIEESVLYQLRAMESMRERLGQMLDADQYEELENWFRMGDKVLRASLPKEE